MSRNLTPTMPLPPSGYEDRVIRETPREALDNSAYGERILQASYKYQAPSLYPASVDVNLYDRVAAVKDVANADGHETSDYPGETNWFIANSAYQGSAYLTITLASGKSLKAYAPYQGSYTNSVQICTDGMTYKPLELGVNYAPEISAIKTGSGTTEVSYSRFAKYDRMNGSTQMYAWIHRLDSTVVFTNTLSVVANTTKVWSVSIGATETWTEGATVTSIVQGTEVYLRGRLARGTGEACPRFGGNADAITKVEGELLALLDATGRTWACGVPYQFAGIFQGCTALTDASGLVFPSGAPGRGLIHRLYQEMFANCTALTGAPSLANVSVSSRDDKQAIFQGMFYHCEALEIPPVLPVVSWLPFGCYKRCFQGCYNLKYIRIEGLNGIQGDALIYWMNDIPGGTAENPRYFYHPNCSKRFRFPSGSGIPASWTPVPEVETKIYFSVQGEGGVVTATRTVDGVAIPLTYGESVLRNSVVDVTPTANEGYSFDHWVAVPAYFTENPTTHVLHANTYPYNTEDRVEMVAVFTHN